MTIADRQWTGQKLSAQTAELYAAHLATLDGRLEAALEATTGDGLVVFAGGQRAPERDDVAWPFRVEPYFKAWVPLTRQPGSILKLVPGRRPVLIYLQSEDFWHEPPEDPAGFWAAHFEIRRVRSDAEALRALGDCTGCTAIGAPEELGGLFAAIDDGALLNRLDYERAFKTAYEIECLREANRIAARGHLATLRAAATGHSEFELAMLYCEATGQRETELPYPSIVALNEHAAVLHYQNLDRARPPQLRSFLLDAGASYQGYAADVTRCWCAAQSEFASLVASVDAAQQALCAEIAAGIEFIELNARAHRLLAATMVEHGLLRCPAEQAYEEGITRHFLPHGLGHLIGLQVHDAGGRQIDPQGAQRRPPPEHPHLRLTRRLEPGFAVTIEPGLYLIPSLLDSLAASKSARHVDWDRIRRLLPCGGVRIEDDVVVMADGISNLTREALAEAGADDRRQLH